MISLMFVRVEEAIYYFEKVRELEPFLITSLNNLGLPSICWEIR
ncbi:MAG: hypothetical protein ACTSVB_00555 [Candidatus Heimdallarchaeaceae archaeon]